MDNRKYNCKKRRKNSLLSVHWLCFVTNTTVCSDYIFPTNSFSWQVIRKYMQSNYTIYKINYRIENVGAASVNDIMTT